MWCVDAHSCLTLCDPVDCSPPGSSVQGILQARTLGWAAMPSSRGSPRAGDGAHISCVSCTTGGFFTTMPPGKPCDAATFDHGEVDFCVWCEVGLFPADKETSFPVPFPAQPPFNQRGPTSSQSCIEGSWSPLCSTGWVVVLSSAPHSLMPSVSQLFSRSVVSDSLWPWLDCSTPGLPVHHQLPEFTPTHVHWVGDAIQPSHPLSSPSPPAFNLSQHQGLFQWVSLMS